MRRNTSSSLGVFTGALCFLAIMTTQSQSVEETSDEEITREMLAAGLMTYEFYARSASPTFLVREIYKAMHAASHPDRLQA